MLEQLKFDGCGVTVGELATKAIKTLQMFEPENRPYWGCFNGGKDSIVIKEIARLAGVRVDWYYNQTTIDPPELIYYMREHHPDVEWKRAKTNFFTMMVKRGFPTRRARWCCAEYKENRNEPGETLILGVRAAESPRRRATWKLVTYHTITKTNAIAPIVAWTDDDVWAFIKGQNLPYCSLYDEGFKRLGCIGCPMARAARKKEFARWPGYERAWKRAFRLIWEKRAGKPQRDGREWFGSALFKNWEEMWEWWLNDNPLPSTGDEVQGVWDFVKLRDQIARENQGDECQGMLDLWS